MKAHPDGGHLQSFKDPNAVASIVDALRHAHGNAIVRLMLIKGFTLADLIDSLLRSPIKNREAIKLANHALGSGDFLTEPQIGGTSHLSYFYDPPGSLHVVDIAIDTPHSTISSVDIRLWLRDIDAV